MNDNDIISKMNACTYLSFRELSEPTEHSLRIVIDEARVEGPLTNVKIGNVLVSDVREIQTSSDSFSFELLWPFYVTYSVTPESYARPDESAQGEGRLFCIYSKSHFLDYAKISTFFLDYAKIGTFQLGPVQHWAVYCINHVVDVVSHKPPLLRIISP